MDKKQIKLVISNICEFLIDNLDCGKFPERTFYGEMFCALALANFDKKRYESIIRKILIDYCCYTVKDSPEFHWEFNNYAYLCLKDRVDLSEYDKYIFPMHFKGTRSTNWILLRYISKVKINEVKAKDKLEFLFRSFFLIRKSGFIKDSIYDNSFQYHFFSTYLILELFLISGKKKFKKKFMKAIAFSRKFILSDGTSEYIGRGQFQIFGIGPLLISLEYAYRFSKEKEYKRVQADVWNNLLKCQREDGSFPLVLPEDELIKSEKMQNGEKSFLGWYSYNNYFDYLPFLAFYLTELNEIYEECDFDYHNRITDDYYAEDFSYIRRQRYEAVASNPIGSWANALPIPFVITSEGRRITNTYGGEQYRSVLYSEKGIPLPWGKIENDQEGSFVGSMGVVLKILLKKNKIELLKLYRKNILTDNDCFYFLSKLSYSLNKGNLDGVSECIDHRRVYKYEEDMIKVKDEIWFKKDVRFIFFYPVYLLVDKEYIGKKALDWNEGCIAFHTEYYSLLISCDEKFDLDETIEIQYNAQRELRALAGKSRRVEYQKGEKIIVEYRFLLKQSE